MTQVRRTFIFVALTTALASSLCLIGGVGLEYISDRILSLVPLLIAIPSLNNLVGDYSSIIAAHTGDPKEGKRIKRTVARAIFKIIWINISAIIALSVGGALLRGYEFDAVFAGKFAIFVAGASILTVLFMFVIARLLDVILKKRRINPDELLIPIITSLADIVMLLLVTLAVLTIF